ncbi:hypothetical protein BG006_006199 [Podila minutissima]|uniref:Uncharacterized protein n=1 Tax=Podila minutissima TaxID=64525 RepID=A0A9P5SLG2_9FUNG|nr:hypothetical protein BG006_006199 [Podila minutissima]
MTELVKRSEIQFRESCVIVADLVRYMCMHRSLMSALSRAMVDEIKIDLEVEEGRQGGQGKKLKGDGLAASEQWHGRIKEK